MRIINPSVKLEDSIDGQEILKKIERIGRVCYKSEGNITEDSAERFVKNLMNKNHESVLEHVNISVRVICDRGVTHEIVRHRIASYSQESTRYCNYSNDKFGNELTFIKPCFWKNENNETIDNIIRYDSSANNFEKWVLTCKEIEDSYFEMLENGATPQEARSILPNSIKTEIVMTMNLREWRHFFKLRCDKAAHPQMRQVANLILNNFKVRIPVIFDDIEPYGTKVWEAIVKSKFLKNACKCKSAEEVKQFLYDNDVDIEDIDEKMFHRNSCEIMDSCGLYSLDFDTFEDYFDTVIPIYLNAVCEF